MSREYFVIKDDAEIECMALDALEAAMRALGADVTECSFGEDPLAEHLVEQAEREGRT